MYVSKNPSIQQFTPLKIILSDLYNLKSYNDDETRLHYDYLNLVLIKIPKKSIGMTLDSFL